MKTALLTTAFDYGVNDLRVFCNSARRNGYQGDIVIIGGHLSGDYLSFFAQTGVRFIESGDAPRGLSKARWGIYLPYLDEYEYVLGIDLRDAAIQSDLSPFWKEGLHVTEEAGPISIEGYNSIWIVQEFGQEVLNQIKDYSILCGGTVWGDSEAMRKWCAYASSKTLSSASTDQGLLNGSVRTGIFQAIVHPNRERVWTLALEGYTGEGQPIQPTPHSMELGKLITPEGYVPDVVHQYDRWKSLAQYYQEYYQ